MAITKQSLWLPPLLWFEFELFPHGLMNVVDTWLPDDERLWRWRNSLRGGWRNQNRSWEVGLEVTVRPYSGPAFSLLPDALRCNKPWHKPRLPKPCSRLLLCQDPLCPLKLSAKGNLPFFHLLLQEFFFFFLFITVMRKAANTANWDMVRSKPF